MAPGWLPAEPWLRLWKTIKMRMEAFAGDTTSIQQLGEEIVTNLCKELLEMGAPGLHFYTMNLSAPTLKIWDNLNLSN